MIVIEDLWNHFEQLRKNVNINNITLTPAGKASSAKVIKAMKDAKKSGMFDVFFVPYLIEFPNNETMNGAKARPYIALKYRDGNYLAVYEPIIAIHFYNYLNLLCRKNWLNNSIFAIGMYLLDVSLIPGEYLPETSSFSEKETSDLGRPISERYFPLMLGTELCGTLNKFHTDNVMQVWPPPVEELLQEYAPSKIVPSPSFVSIPVPKLDVSNESVNKDK